MNETPTSLLDAVSRELQRSCHPSSLALAEAIAARHKKAAVAVLFYGSCLRQDPSDVPPEGIQDFYLLVDRYQHAYGARLPALANWLLPPNVFYIEHPWHGRTLRAKYAVMTLNQFMRGTSPRSFDPWLWARFSQPAALLRARDEVTRARVQKAIARAVRTMLKSTAPLVSMPTSPKPLWLEALRQTYRVELRPEGANRAEVIIDAERERYDRMARLVFAKAVDSRGMIAIDVGDDERRRMQRRWFVRRLLGKPLTVLRLMKNLFTFDGGVDYALWKVERHTGVRVPISSFERRHPILTSPRLLWRVFRLGAVR